MCFAREVQPPAPRVPLLRRSSELPAFSALLLRSSGTRKSARSSGKGERLCPRAGYQPITMFDSITLRERSRSEPVCCM